MEAGYDHQEFLFWACWLSSIGMLSKGVRWTILNSQVDDAELPCKWHLKCLTGVIKCKAFKGIVQKALHVKDLFYPEIETG